MLFLFSRRRFFEDLRSPKWTKLLRYCDYKKTVYVNKPFINDLHADLATILEYDGRYRDKIGILAFMLGNDAEEALNFSKKQDYLDSLNLAEVERIIKKSGFIGIGRVKEDLEGVVALVIIHAPHEIKKKYLPIFLTAYKEKKLPFNDVKLLIDKIYTHETNTQIFGTQFGFWDETLHRRTLYPLMNAYERLKIIKELGFKLD